MQTMFYCLSHNQKYLFPQSLMLSIDLVNFSGYKIHLKKSEASTFWFITPFKWGFVYKVYLLLLCFKRSLSTTLSPGYFTNSK